jgi:hypothetical protein
MRVALPIVSMVTIGIAVVVVLGVGGSTQAPSLANLGFPPAALAGHDFTAAAAGTRGVTASLGRIASDGAVAVAVGAETGVQVPRAEYFISQNDGGSWSLATESAAGEAPRHQVMRPGWWPAVRGSGSRSARTPSGPAPRVRPGP